MTEEMLQRVLETILLAPPGSLVIFRGLPPAAWEQMMDAVRNRPSEFGDHLILSMPKDTDVVSLDTEEMAKAGWQRIAGWDEALDEVDLAD